MTPFRIPGVGDIEPRRRETKLIPIATYHALVEAVRYADSRAVSLAAYPHACVEERKLRDLIDAALAAIGGDL